MRAKEPSILRPNPDRGNSPSVAAAGEIILTIDKSADNIHAMVETLRQSLRIPETPAIQLDTEGNTLVYFQLRTPRIVRSQLVTSPKGEENFQDFLRSIGSQPTVNELAELNALGFARSHFSPVDTALEMRKEMVHLLATHPLFQKVSVTSFKVPTGHREGQMNDFSADFTASSTESNEMPSA